MQMTSTPPYRIQQRSSHFFYFLVALAFFAQTEENPCLIRPYEVLFSLSLHALCPLFAFLPSPSSSGHNTKYRHFLLARDNSFFLLQLPPPPLPRPLPFSSILPFDRVKRTIRRIYSKSSSFLLFVLLRSCNRNRSRNHSRSLFH
jgi:hypothetical protein